MQLPKPLSQVLPRPTAHDVFRAEHIALNLVTRPLLEMAARNVPLGTHLSSAIPSFPPRLIYSKFLCESARFV
jgi:hypothetical protein